MSQFDVSSLAKGMFDARVQVLRFAKGDHDAIAAADRYALKLAELRVALDRNSGSTGA